MKKNTKLLKDIYTEALICEMPIMIPYEQNFHFKYCKIPKDTYNYIISKYANPIMEYTDGTEKYNIYTEIETIKNIEILNYFLASKIKKTIVGNIKIIKIKGLLNKVYFTIHDVWRDKTANRNLISNFILKSLLPKYKIILSDTSTNKLGKEFLLKLVEYCLTNNKECGIFTNRSILSDNEKEFKTLNNIADFEEAWDNLGMFKRIYIKD